MPITASPEKILATSCIFAIPSLVAVARRMAWIMMDNISKFNKTRQVHCHIECSLFWTKSIKFPVRNFPLYPVALNALPKSKLSNHEPT